MSRIPFPPPYPVIRELEPHVFKILKFLELHWGSPIIIFDTETTGELALEDRAVEISVLSSRGEEFYSLVNPERTIEQEAAEIHGISNEMVKEAPTFKRLATTLETFIGAGNCILTGYNTKGYDVKLIGAEFQRSGMFYTWPGPWAEQIDIIDIYFKLFPRTLTAAIKEILGEDHEDAHGARSDTIGSLRLLAGLMNRFPELQVSKDDLLKFLSKKKPSWVDSEGKFRWRDGKPVCAFGNKHNGKTMQYIARFDPGYFSRFMLGPTATFAEDTKALVKNALNGIFPEPPGKVERTTLSGSSTDDKAASNTEPKSNESSIVEVRDGRPLHVSGDDPF